MPFRISRLLCIGGRPPGFARGTSASSCSHSGSVRSVSYALRHVIGAHQHTAPTLFKRALSERMAESFHLGAYKLEIFPTSRRIFLRDGKFLQEGDVLRQPELAATLER